MSMESKNDNSVNVEPLVTFSDVESSDELNNSVDSIELPLVKTTSSIEESSIDLNISVIDPIENPSVTSSNIQSSNTCIDPVELAVAVEQAPATKNVQNARHLGYSHW